MFMTFNPGSMPPEQPVSEQVPAEKTEETRPAEESTEETPVLPEAGSEAERPQTSIQAESSFKGLEASVEGKVLSIVLPKEADLERSVILVNGKRMTETEMMLEKDGEIHLSWQLCDQEGIVLESREMILQADFTGPAISFGQEKDTLWISEEKELSFIITDESGFTWEAFLNGESLGKAKSVLLKPGDHNLTVIAEDEHGNQGVRSLKILQAPSVLSEWAGQSRVQIQDGLLSIELGGDYQGCFIRAEKNGIVSDMLCDASRMELRLPFDGEMKLSLIHPSAGELQSWIITSEKKEEAAPILPEAENTPVQETALPVQKNEVPVKQTQPAVAEKKPALELWSARERVKEGECLYLSAETPAGIEVHNGKLEKMEFSIDGKRIEASSLLQALQENPQAVITASIEARDLASQLIRQQIQVARLPEPVKTTISAMNAQQEIAFSLDEKGMLSVKSEPVSRAMTSSLTVNGITTWKWYGFNPETMNIYINETRVEHPQTGKNFLGKTYVEVQVEGSALVQIEEEGRLRHSEIVGSQGGNQVLYTDSSDAIDLTAPVLVLLAVLGAVPVLRFVKRRRARGTR